MAPTPPPSWPSQAPVFKFGAGAEHSFQTEPAEPLTAAQSSFQLELVSGRLADAQTEIRRLRIELATASRQATVSDSAERVARGLVQQYRAEYLHLEKSLDALETKMAARDDSGDYDRIVELQSQLENRDATIRGLREQISQKDKDLKEASTAAQEATKKVDKLTADLDGIRTTNDTLRSDIDHEKAAARDREDFLNKAYADRKDAEDARLAALDARDALEQELVGLRFDRSSLEEQLQNEHQEKCRLQNELDQMSYLEEENRNLEADVERLQSHIDDHERTLIVKDERITNLELQYQKERQRNLTADAALAAATATPGSPIEENTPITFSTVGETLADELDGNYNEDHEEYEEYLDFSNIVPAFDFAPIAPASTPNTITPRASESSTEPAIPPIPRLSVFVHDTGAVAVAPVAPPQPKLDFSQFEAGNIAPITPAPPKLGISHSEASNITPVAPAQPKLTSHLKESAMVEPITPTTQPLTFAVNDIDGLDIEPVEPVTPQQPILGFAALSTTIDFSPVDPVDPVELNTVFTQTQAQSLSTHIIRDATVSVAPVEMQEQILILPAQNNDIGDITFTLDVEPQDAQHTAADTANGITQTIATGPATDAPAPIPIQRNKISTLQAIWPLLACLLILTVVLLQNYLELNAWRTANGVGMNRRYGNSMYRGAYGNGRYLLGYPVAQDVGNSWISECVAKYSSVAISRVEEWFGISQQITY